MPPPASDPIPRSPDLSHSSDNRGTHFPRWMLGLEGSKVKGGLRLGHILGTGAFGVVYVGTGSQFANNRPVAVKVLSATDTNPERHHQIGHEMLCHSRVSKHPNVVTLHNVFVDFMAYYAVMDLHAEGDLFKCITEDELYVGNDALIKTVFGQLLDAVEFCHENGVYHRDLKPENILCRSRGNTVMLTDFGLATRNTFSQDFRCGKCIGLPKVKAYSTPHNDIWALGVILVNLITSRNPWKCAEQQDRGFDLFYKDPAGYIADTLPVSRDALVLLLRIFRIPFKSRISISGIRAALVGIDRLLLTPAEAASAPDGSFETAVHLFNIIAIRRPHLLIEHYEDICAYFPLVAEGLCVGLRLDMTEHGLVGDIDDIFSDNAPEPIRRTHRELPEWSAPIPIEIRPRGPEELSGYPRSPGMSRDNTAETIASEGPITPDTHPTQIADDVPEVALDGDEGLERRKDNTKITRPADSPPVNALSAFSNRIARVLGSTGSFFR